MNRALPLVGLCALLAAGASLAEPDPYPLDGHARSGIERLRADSLRQDRVKGGRVPPGALLGVDDIRLQLTREGRDWDLSDRQPDPTLQRALHSIFARRDPSYAIVVVDITRPDSIAWAGLRPGQRRFQGSVGKLVTMVALFHELARAFPDTSDRLRVLRETMVTGGRWATGDNFHKVPIVDPRTGALTNRSIRADDRFPLAAWVDHMCSASANSAGATVWKQAMLLRQFGDRYPVPEAEAEAFLAQAKPLELQALSQVVNEEPLQAAGIDTRDLRQGTLWTKPAQARVPGMVSYATPRELARLLLRMEQGRLVDEWSSREMKRFLYMTRPRYRYAYPRELHDSAVYFKSGSFFRCVPEEGYDCRKYMGNKQNLMNSVAIVESPATPGPEQRRYLVALTSNVLKLNSAWDHARLAAAIDEAVRTRQPVAVREGGSEDEIRASGGG